MTLRIPAKVLLHVWSYDFYDMTLSTGKQRRHMIIHILTHLAYIANGKKACYIVRQFHWANKRDVTLRHL